MRVLFIALALMLVCGAAALAAANSPGQAMVDACLSKCLNVSPSQIADLRSQGCSDADIAIACAIAGKASKPISEVMASYASTKDWPTIAGKYNLSMADLISAPVSGSPDSEAFNTAFFAQYYSLPQDQIAQLRRQGFSWDDVNVISNASLCTKQPVNQIAGLRKDGASWSEIAAKYSVASEALTNPVKVTLVSTYNGSQAAANVGAGPAVSPSTVQPAASTCPAPCPATCPEPATCPAPCPSVCATGPTSCCGNGPCLVCDGDGNLLLNYDQAMQLYVEGHDWLDVAIAINVTRYTGYPIRQVLTDLKSLGTWQQNLVYYGVPEDYAYNVADYPFPRRSIYSLSEDAKHVQMICKYQKPGTWPTCPRGNPVCPGGVGNPVNVVPVPCPNPCGTGPVCPAQPTVPCPCPTTTSPCEK